MMHLTITDLIMLKAIKLGNGPAQAELLNVSTKHGLVNDLIKKYNLPVIYGADASRIITSNWGLLASITRLRNAGLMPRVAPYRLTEEGEALLRQLGDNPKTWPIDIPFDLHGLYLDDAVYVPQELRDDEA
jgi:hypothetical protein